MSSTVLRSGDWCRTAVRWLVPIILAYLVLLTALLALGNHWSPPSDRSGATTSLGGLHLATQALIGRNDPTDLLVDYASTHALTHGGDAYGISSRLIHGVGPDWPVGTANPHPPTVLTLMLPLMLVRYPVALAAWSLAMIFAFVGTLRTLGVPLPYAVPLGLALGLTFPGALGITNVVPLIGLGIAMAYRWRHSPVVAGLGIALAAAPKAFGLVLVLPFLLTARLRAVAWAAFWFGITAAVPLAFDHHVWSRYLIDGVEAIRLNAARGANASLLHWSTSGLTSRGAVAVIALLTLALTLLRRDLYWPLVWATVAVLPIAWMYSSLTFLPLITWLARRNPRRSAPFAVVLAAIAASVAPLGLWSKFGFHAIVILVFVFLLCADPLEPGERMYPPHMLDPLRGRGPWDVGAIPHQLAQNWGRREPPPSATTPSPRDGGETTEAAGHHLTARR